MPILNFRLLTEIVTFFVFNLSFPQGILDWLSVLAVELVLPENIVSFWDDEPGCLRLSSLMVPN